MTAVIGSGKSVISAPVVAFEYNARTHHITLLHPDSSKTKVNTNIDRVAVRTEQGEGISFKGGKHDTFKA